MYQTRKKNGQITRHSKEILNEQKEFYEELYREDKTVNFEIENSFNVKLSQETRDSLEDTFSIADISKSIEELKTEKTPGLDGIPVEFYRKFKVKLIPILQAAYRRYSEEGKLGGIFKKRSFNINSEKGQGSAGHQKSPTINNA